MTFMRIREGAISRSPPWVAVRTSFMSSMRQHRRRRRSPGRAASAAGARRAGHRQEPVGPGRCHASRAHVRARGGGCPHRIPRPALALRRRGPPGGCPASGALRPPETRRAARKRLAVTGICTPVPCGGLSTGRVRHGQGPRPVARVRDTARRAEPTRVAQPPPTAAWCSSTRSTRPNPTCPTACSKPWAPASSRRSEASGRSSRGPAAPGRHHHQRRARSAGRLPAPLPGSALGLPPSVRRIKAHLIDRARGPLPRCRSGTRCCKAPPSSSDDDRDTAEREHWLHYPDRPNTWTWCAPSGTGRLRMPRRGGRSSTGLPTSP